MADPESPPFDIDATADRVVELLNSGQGAEAMRLLEQQRQEQPQAVQEALDRMVAHRGAEAIADLRTRAPNIPEFEPEAAIVNGALARLGTATDAPRLPAETEMEALTATQRYDVYASIVETRGNDAARGDLNSENRVILGLRDENSTLASAAEDDPATALDETQSGKGVYNDRLVVLGERQPEGGGEPEVWEFNRANTEPTAQYDHRAGSDGNRVFGDTEQPAPEMEAAPGYENVSHPRDIYGEDVNGDGMLDAGRLAEGTIEMLETTHPNPRGGTDVSLRPTAEAIAAGEDGVQRDTNGDGRFDTADVSGEDELNRTFKIHRGSRSNTDSAGCQTLHPDDYDAFVDAVRGNADQDRWQYVLTSTADGEQRAQGIEAQDDRSRTEGMETSPRPQPRPEGLGGDGAMESPLRPQPRPEGLGADDGMQQSPRPQPRPEGLGASNTELPRDPLMMQITQAFDASGAGRDLDAEQRNNVLAAAYRAFSPAVDHVGVYGGRLVGTRAPHGLGVEPMDNIPVGIAESKDLPASMTLAMAQREHGERQFIPPIEEPRSVSARM